MDRRIFGQTMLGGAAFFMMRTPQEQARDGGITDVGGIAVGHFTHPDRPTGCTVILTEGGAVGGVDVRGSAPGTRETDLLNPVNTVEEVHAVLLSGGSAFGLDAAGGVVRYLKEKNIGYPTGAARVPIVPAAILYDLGIGNADIWPGADDGYAACRAASAGPVEEGSIGAGAGATVGKTMGMGRAMKGGIGTSSIDAGNGIVVGALVAVNCVGNVIDPATGAIVAGARNADDSGFVDTRRLVREGARMPDAAAQNTTIGVVATSARFDKAGMTKIAQMAQDALARTIYPAHTPFDGDTVFAVSTGSTETPGNLGSVGALAAEVLADAILRAVKRASSLPGIPAYRDYVG